MPLSPAQEIKLYVTIREQFRQDSDAEFGLRVMRFFVRNSPSAAQKAALQPILDTVVADRDATLAAYDANATAGKATIQADRTAVAGLAPNL